MLVLLLLATRLDLLPSVHGFLPSKLNEPNVGVFMVFTALSALFVFTPVASLIEFKLTTIKKSATWDNTRVLILALNTIALVVIMYTSLIVLIALTSLNSTSDHSKVLVSIIIFLAACFLLGSPSYLLTLCPIIESTAISTVLFFRDKRLPLNHQHVALATLLYFMYSHSAHTVIFSEGSDNLCALSPIFKVSPAMVTLTGAIYDDSVSLLDSCKFNASKSNLSSVFTGDPRYLNLSSVLNSSKSDAFFYLEQGVGNLSYTLGLFLLVFISASFKALSRKIKIRPF